MYSDLELCKALYSPKILKDIAYSTELLKTLKSDFKALDSSLDKVDDCDGFKDNIIVKIFILMSTSSQHNHQKKYIYQLIYHGNIQRT